MQNGDEEKKHIGEERPLPKPPESKPPEPPSPPGNDTSPSDNPLKPERTLKKIDPKEE